ncbi:MAG: hypothetical protein NC253_00940 [Ruminococcus sp.]|nr:hypothetical protein [Ruminococcus sp.]MCM1382007.1 hypothetical protein [Muribaculaceae bacterium]MCM1478985.1 hypothetical protein [Muribaculaceae bacterium]
MKNNEITSKIRTFKPKLTDNDTIAFAFLAAEKGLAPEQLIENFVSDIVSSFSADEISEEEKHLADWFNGSWFSQDNDGYFTFLQYIIRKNFYNYVTAALTEIEIYNAEILKHKNSAKNKRLKKKRKEAIKNLFERYCTKNPAHKSFAEEIKIIRDFDNSINKITKGGSNKWH